MKYQSFSFLSVNFEEKVSTLVLYDGFLEVLCVRDISFSI